MKALAKTSYLAGLFLFLAAGSLQGKTVYQGPDFKLRHKGVVRNVFTSGRTLELYASSERYIYDIQRVRSDWFASFKSSFRAAVVYDLTRGIRQRLGDNVKAQLFVAVGLVLTLPHRRDRSQKNYPAAGHYTFFGGGFSRM